MLKSKFFLLTLALVVALSMALACAPSSTGTSGNGKSPILIGYVGNVSSPGTKPCMDLAQIAVDEINESGGVLGRPLKLIVEDGKGETSTAVSAAQRMIMGTRPVAYFSEGRSEIALALKETSAGLYKDYPHIQINNGAADYEVTEKLVSQYDKYKFFFRDFEFAQYPWYYNQNLTIMKDLIKAKKIAILYEDLIWTRVYREGSPVTNLPGMKEYVTKKGLFEVVYEKNVKPRSGMWLPVLENVANSGAEAMFIYTSWYTDVEVLAKQWADSSAKDIPILATGGILGSYGFWDMTGGKCNGMITHFWNEDQVPVTPKLFPLVKKAQKAGIPIQFHVLLAYNDVYGLKAAMEKANTTTDIEAMIKALETTQYEGAMGPSGYHPEKVEPWFHSGMISDPKDPTNLMFPDKSHIPWKQWQGKDKVQLIYTSPGFMSYAHPELYKSPAQLRSESGIK